MYEIYLDDQSGHVLARSADVREADRMLGRIGDQTRAQLAANGEGGDRFVLRLAVRDTSTGVIVMRAGIYP